MKSIEELNPHNLETNQVIDKNLVILYERLEELQDAIGIDLVINSGLRSQEAQNKLIAAKKSKAVNSLHLVGAAADIKDKDGKIAKWVMSNLNFMKIIGLWIESPDYCKGWVHVQIFPPKSGNRVFIP